MKYFYDTEFLENGRTIELISIGIIAEDGREYYAINSDMPVDDIRKDDWLLENVWKHLPLIGYKTTLRSIGGGKTAVRTSHPGILDRTNTLVKPKWVIANEVREFLLKEDTQETELWADYAAYDHVVLAQLFGRMIRLPKGIPMYTNDLQTLLGITGAHHEIPEQEGDLHNALEDARHLMRSYTIVEDLLL